MQIYALGQWCPIEFYGMMETFWETWTIEHLKCVQYNIRNLIFNLKLIVNIHMWLVTTLLFSASQNILFWGILMNIQKDSKIQIA